MARVRKGPILVIVVTCLAIVLLLLKSFLGKTSTIASAEPPSEALPSSAPVQALAGQASVRFCGSNTIGADLAPALAEEFLKSKNAQEIRQEKGGDLVAVSGRIAGNMFRIEIRSAGTGTAFQDMGAGKCDIAMASREVLSEERSSLGNGLTEQVLGLDGIAVIVNSGNSLNKLTIPQVASLFSGAVRNWTGVGGSIGEVDLVSYDEKSGTYDTFKKLVLGGGSMTPTAKKFVNSSDVVQGVAADPFAVGYTSLSSARGVKILEIGEPGTEPLAPTPWTVVRESYPLTRRLYLYTHNRFTQPAADSLVLFALSNAGQAVVERTGFVGLAIKAEPPQACVGCPPAYLQATYGSQRLSVDFRFQNGSSELDSRAVKDADRVGDFSKGGRSKILLLGFADNSGSPGANQKLSLERAEKVKAELSRHGLQDIATQGMGSMMPTASNATEEGRQKNRRVEVWVH